MFFSEPKVEFVEIKMSEITASSCTTNANQSMGSVTTCMNPGSDENACSSTGVYTF